MKKKICKCGCGKEVTWNVGKCIWNKFIHGHNNANKGNKLTKEQRRNISIKQGGNGVLKEDTEPPLCACGNCKEKVGWSGRGYWNKFVIGHNRKREDIYRELREQDPPLCECGCKEKVVWNKNRWNKYVVGHNARGKPISEAHKQSLLKANIGRPSPMKGIPLTEEHKKNIGLGNKGKIVSKETCKIISKNTTAFMNSSKNPNIGRKQTEEHKRNIAKGNKGLKRSEETKRNQSKARKKYLKDNPEAIIKMSLALKGRIGPNLGKTFSEKTKRKQSISKKEYFKDPEARIRNSCAQQGISREEWTHFVSCDPYCQIWTKEYKDFIKERDEYKCLNPNCRKISDRLCIHHIDYDKKHCTPWNNITLCFSCNSRANGNRKYWQEFYTNIIKNKYNYGR